MINKRKKSNIYTRMDALQAICDAKIHPEELRDVQEYLSQLTYLCEMRKNIVSGHKHGTILGEWWYGFPGEATIKELNRYLSEIAQTLDVHFPDEEYSNKKLTLNDMLNFGYTWLGMLPVTAETAKELFSVFEVVVYALYPDNSESEVGTIDEIESLYRKGAMFGIQRSLKETSVSDICEDLLFCNYIRAIKTSFGVGGTEYNILCDTEEMAKMTEECLEQLKEEKSVSYAVYSKILPESPESKDQKVLNGLIGKKYPVDSFEECLKDYFFAKRRRKKLWWSNIPTKIQDRNGNLHEVNFRCCLEYPDEEHFFCLKLEHKDGMVYITKGYLEEIYILN